MGVLGLGTPAELKDFTSLDGIRNLSDPRRQALIDRAEAYLDSLEEYDTTISGYTSIMEIAVYKVCQLLYIRDRQVEASAGIFKSEKIGSYQYIKSDNKDLNFLEIDPELAAYVTRYAKDSIGITTTRVFRELDKNEDTGLRDYKDVYDKEFEYADDRGIQSGTNEARDL